MLSPFFVSSFVWNLCQGMTNVLVPLYALELGMSGVRIGTLLSLPVILQLVFNLLGGAYVDRVGAKNMLYASCITMLIAAVTFILASDFAVMLVGYALFVLSRASFWPANYAMGSQLPGERALNMSRLNSVTNAGQITGTAVAGMLIHAVGFMASFWLSGVTAFVALLLTSTMSVEPVKRSPAAVGIIQTYRGLAVQRPMYFAMVCAFLSVLPFTIVASFGAILLVSGGYTSGETGWMLTLRAFGAIFAGTALARAFHTALDRRVPLWSCAMIGAGFALLPAFDDPLPVGVFIFLLGISSGVVSIYFQLLISAVSPSAVRGSAISYGGVGWNLCNMLAPLAMGAFMDALGIRGAFYVLGALMLATTALLVPLYRWSFAGGDPAESR